MDLLTVVVQPTWKEFLIDLVRSRQMDPWDIDLVAVADAYLLKIRELQALDLRVPANVILACALMLKFKSETLSFEEEPEEAYEETPALLQEDIPELVYRANRPRRRRVTLQELLDAVDEVMKQGPRPLLKTVGPKEISIELPQIDMNELMQAVYDKALQLKDTESVLLFSALLNADAVAQSSHADGHNKNFESPAEKTVFYLLPVLHLVQEQKLLAWQDAEFGEIFLKIVA